MTKLAEVERNRVDLLTQKDDFVDIFAHVCNTQLVEYIRISTGHVDNHDFAFANATQNVLDDVPTAEKLVRTGACKVQLSFQDFRDGSINGIKLLRKRHYQEAGAWSWYRMLVCEE